MGYSRNNLGGITKDGKIRLPSEIVEDIKQLEQQNKELLEALIDYHKKLRIECNCCESMQCNDNEHCDIDKTEKLIEKAKGKTWEQIND